VPPQKQAGDSNQFMDKKVKRLAGDIERRKRKKEYSTPQMGIETKTDSRLGGANTFTPIPRKWRTSDSAAFFV
jgi:hypothetical protein